MKYTDLTNDNFYQYLNDFDRCPEGLKEEYATNLYRYSVFHNLPFNDNHKLYRYADTIIDEGVINTCSIKETPEELDDILKNAGYEVIDDKKISSKVYFYPVTDEEVLSNDVNNIDDNLVYESYSELKKFIESNNLQDKYKNYLIIEGDNVLVNKFDFLINNTVNTYKKKYFGESVPELLVSRRDVDNLHSLYKDNKDINEGSVTACPSAPKVIYNKYIDNPSKEIVINDITYSISDLLGRNNALYNENIKPNKVDALDEELSAIYIVLSYTYTPFGKIIKKVTNSTFSHACISFDNKLHNMYSYNANNETNKAGGFSIENINNYTKYSDESIIGLYVVFLKNKYVQIIKDYVSNLKKNIINTKYSFSNIFNVLLNRANDDNPESLNMICSEFVAMCFKYIGVNLIKNKSTNLITPEDLSKIESKSCYCLYHGKIKEYKPSKIDRIINNYKKKAISIKENGNYDIDFNDNNTFSEGLSPSKRKEMEKVIYETMNILDKTGKNAQKYKELFSKMSNEQFDKYMKKFLSDDNENFYMEILPNINEPTLKQIKQAADYLKIPLDEYVYYRDDGDKDNPVRTSYRVPTGYLHLKRMQQTLSKKNTYSLSISSRNYKTGGLTAHDKISRISDLETSALSAIGAEYALKEFLSPRADNMENKNQMYRDISMYGYTYLKDLEDETKGQAIQTIKVYLTGAGIENDV